MAVSEKYRLMIYFAHSTMVMYSKDIKCDEKMSLEEFINLNPDLIKRISDESISIFEYELSYNQILAAIHVFLNSKYKPSSVSETEVYVLKK